MELMDRLASFRAAILEGADAIESGEPLEPVDDESGAEVGKTYMPPAMVLF